MKESVVKAEEAWVNTDEAGAETWVKAAAEAGVKATAEAGVSRK